MLNLLNLLPLLALSLTITSEAKPVSLSKRFTGVHLVSGRDGKCLSVAPGTVDRGLAVTTVDCNTANTARTWDLNPGSGSVFFSGSGLALDAGSNPGNNGNVKVSLVLDRINPPFTLSFRLLLYYLLDLTL